MKGDHEILHLEKAHAGDNLKGLKGNFSSKDNGVAFWASSVKMRRCRVAEVAHSSLKKDLLPVVAVETCLQAMVGSLLRTES